MKTQFKYLTSIRIWTVLIIALLFTAQIHAQRGSSPGDTTPSQATSQNGRYVSIDFNDVEIGVFIKFISELTGKNFVVDQRVKGKVTIISPSKISIDEAYKVFESVLEVNGFATVKSGEVVKIVPAPDARTKNIKTLLKAESGRPDDRVVTQLIPLKYANPEEVKKLFTPLISKNSVLLAYAPTNMLILTDIQSNVQRLMNILKVIDVTDIGQQLTVIPIEYADATKLVKLIEQVFETRQKKAKGAIEQGIKLVADERTNTLVLLASEGETERVKALIRLIDKETPRGSERIRVYYLEHAKAEDLATALQSLSTTKAAPAPGKKGPLVSGSVSITADKATNSLIIMAEKDEYLVLEDIIRKLDIPRAMVYIECLIMEVNVNKDFNLGMEWRVGDDFNNNEGVYYGGFSGGDDSGFSESAGLALGSFPPGYSMGVFNDVITIGNVSFPSIGALVSAYKKDKDVHILSTPQVLTTDNEEATISVGKNVPYKTKSGTDVSGGNVGDVFYETFEYKDVGITLKITPQISKDRLVRLSLAQEVSRLESTADFRPTTLKRTIETTVIVHDKNTVVIGGLIDDSFSNIEYKTPCLGDIPGFGSLFSSVGRADEKTNLYVFLTPHVIQNPSEANTVYQEKKEDIESISEGKVKMYEEDDQQKEN